MLIHTLRERAMNGHAKIAVATLLGFLLWGQAAAAQPETVSRYADKAVALLRDAISR